MENYICINGKKAELTEEQRAWEWDDTLVREDWTVDTEKEGELTRNRSIVNSRGGTLELEGAINGAGKSGTGTQFVYGMCVSG